MKSILYNSESLDKAEGGISSASRLFIKYLNKKKSNLELDIKINCFRSYENKPPYNINLSYAKRSKIKFFVQNIIQLLNNNLVFYDHIDLAKAHINFLNKNYCIFGWGVDMWEMSKRQLKISQNAKKLIICSEFSLKKMKKIYDSEFENAHVCWLATPTDEYNKKIIIKKKKIINFLIVGRIDDERKGHFQLLDVWKELKKKYTNIRLDIIGASIIENKINDKIKEYNLSNSVSYHGYVSHDKIEKFWEKADVFVMPGTVEGFGIVYIEAMKNSLPVIASIHDAGNEINKNGITGFNIDQFDKKEFINAMSNLIENDNLRRDFSNNAFLNYKNNFKFSDYEKRMDKIFLNFNF